MSNPLVEDVREIIAQYNVTVTGPYPYNGIKFTADVTIPPNPPVPTDFTVPVDVFVQMVACLKGYYNFVHAEIKQTILATIWISQNVPGDIEHYASIFRME